LEGLGLDLSGLGYGQKVGFCESRNDISASIICGDIIDSLRNYQLFKKYPAPFRQDTGWAAR
jgi:hypothetical protein